MIIESSLTTLLHLAATKVEIWDQTSNRFNQAYIFFLVFNSADITHVNFGTKAYSLLPITNSKCATIHFF